MQCKNRKDDGLTYFNHSADSCGNDRRGDYTLFTYSTYFVLLYFFTCNCFAQFFLGFTCFVLVFDYTFFPFGSNLAQSCSCLGFCWKTLFVQYEHKNSFHLFFLFFVGLVETEQKDLFSFLHRKIRYSQACVYSASMTLMRVDGA